MLIKFSTKNFRGFKDTISWDLQAHSNYSFNESCIKDGVIKNGIMFGPNGGGKTGFGLAVFDIVNHLSQKMKKSDYYDNFIYAGNANGLVDFEYTFKFGSVVLFYKYSKTKDGVLVAESLSVNNSPIFERAGKKFFIDEAQFPMEDNAKEYIAQNANGVSIINNITTTYPLSQEHYLWKLKSFVDNMLWYKSLDAREFIGLETKVFFLNEYINKKKLKADFQNFIEEVSGQKFQFVDSENNDKELLCKIGNNAVPFDAIASTGTEALKLLYFWLQRIKNASLIFIDEFDAFYHFGLSIKVCRQLFGLDGQVFLTSHNTSLISNELLRPDCYFFIGEGIIKPFSKCTDKELRYGHNLEKLYRGNAFSL